MSAEYYEPTGDEVLDGLLNNLGRLAAADDEAVWNERNPRKAPQLFRRRHAAHLRVCRYCAWHRSPDPAAELRAIRERHRQVKAEWIAEESARITKLEQVEGEMLRHLLSFIDGEGGVQ